MEKKFTKATLAVIFLSVIALAAIMTPIAKAQNTSVTLTPSKGPEGTQVIIEIFNFPFSSTFSVIFGGSDVGTINAGSGYNQASTLFDVPAVSPGVYTVSVTDSQGEVAKTTFTVTQTSYQTPAEAPQATSAPSEGVSASVLIVIIIAVIAIASFIAVMYVKRGRQKPSSYQEASRLEPRASTLSKAPYSASKINQPSTYSQQSSYSSSRINQPATSSPKTPFTRVCPHCKRTVRDDLNICPYCSKRLR